MIFMSANRTYVRKSEIKDISLVIFLSLLNHQNKFQAKLKLKGEIICQVQTKHH